MISKLAQTVFETHIYEWDGRLFVQSEVCPADLRSSGPMSRLVMGKWVAEMHNKAELCNTLAIINPISYSRLNFHCLVKYVDGILTAADKIPKGCKWNTGLGALMWS